MILNSWKQVDSDVRAFLAEFERHGGDTELDDGEQFAAEFLASDPNQAVH
jgi:hypothetical protein